MNIKEIKKDSKIKFKLNNRNAKELMGIVLIVILFVATVRYFSLKNLNLNNNSEENIIISNEVQNEVDETPVEGGELLLSVSKFSSLDPYKNKDKSLDDILHLFYDSLFEFDKEYNLKNELATSYQVSNEGKNISVTLGKNKWQDGTYITANDVIFTVNYIKSNPESPYYHLVSNIEDVRGNNNIVNFSLRNNNSLGIYNFIFPIINKKSLVNNDFRVIANGMYKVDEIKKGKYIKLSFNENYSIEPYIKNITVNIYENNKIRKNMFLSQKTDIIASDNYSLKDYEYSIFNKKEYQSNKYDLVVYNYKKELFSQSINRKKIFKILDLNDIREEIYKSYAVYKDFPLFRYEYKGKDDDILAYTLEYSDTLTIVVDKNDPIKYRLAYEIQNKLIENNMKAQVKGFDSNEFLESLNAGNFDIAILTYNASYDNNIMNIFSNSFLDINNADLNTYMQAYKTSSIENYEKRFNIFMDKFYNYKYFIGLGFRKNYVIYNNRIGGELDSTQVEIYNGIENIYIKNK